MKHLKYEVLGADRSTVELLQKGFRLERNNRTAREDLDFGLKKKMLEYKQKGSIKSGEFKPKKLLLLKNKKMPDNY